MDNNDKVSWQFYGLLTASSLGLIGGMYYLYTLFTDNMEADISEDQKEKLEELVKISESRMSTESENPQEKKESESVFAIKIFKQINELTEEMFNKDKPDWVSHRRNLLKDNKKEEYNSYCENILSEKMRSEQIAAEMILNKLGMSQIELQSMMEKIPQHEFMIMQQEMMKKQQMSSNGQAPKDPNSYKDEEIIKAFKEFLKIKADMDNESRNMAQFMNDQSEEARMQFFVKLEINKYMIDDYLFNLFELDLNTLMMLINARGLHLNKEISDDYQKLIQEFNQAGAY